MMEIVKNYPVRDLIWVENEIYSNMRAVGTLYEMSDILRTYGTLQIAHLFFYPY